MSFYISFLEILHQDSTKPGVVVIVTGVLM